jgi:hypothetical protein
VKPPEPSLKMYQQSRSVFGFAASSASICPQTAIIRCVASGESGRAFHVVHSSMIGSLFLVSSQVRDLHREPDDVTRQ